MCNSVHQEHYHMHVLGHQLLSWSWRLFRNVPNKIGFPYANVLVCFSETSQTASKKANIKVWMSTFQGIKDKSKLKTEPVYM